MKKSNISNIVKHNLCHGCGGCKSICPTNAIDLQITRNGLIEPKIDGVAISLIYENGKLVTGVTRGDGYVGEDITNNIKQIVNIPQILNTTESMEIRGEAYISNRDFEIINEIQQKNNKKLLLKKYQI